MDAVAITELEKIDATRVDGVGVPANGIPILLMKAVAPEVAKGMRDCPKCGKNYDADHQGSTCENCGTDLPDAPAAKSSDEANSMLCPVCKGEEQPGCKGCNGLGQVTAAKAKAVELVKAIVGRKVDESPDIAGGNAVLAQIADLIIAEAQELKAGNTGEIADIQQLACAAEMIWCWRTGEESVASGSVMPATTLMQSAAKSEGWLPWTAADFAYFKKATDDLIARGLIDPETRKPVAKERNYSAAERKEMAGDGRALPDGSYPINDEHDLNSAAILARSGHGDVDAAKKHIGKRAKELGVKNPLESDSDDDTSKSRLAVKETAVDTVTQDDGQIAKAVEDAVTKALAASEGRLKALEAELAKVKAQPVHGGPVMTVMPQAKAVADGEKAAMAKRIRDTAASISDPATAAGYLQWARQVEAEDKTP